MTWYPDLGTATMVDWGDHIRAIGWLHESHSFPVGDSRPEFVRELREITSKASYAMDALGWAAFAGFHTCEFCGEFESIRNVGIPAGAILYVAPEMVSHYVEQHSYLPPEEFVEAVLASPDPDTSAYLTAVEPFREKYRQMRQQIYDQLIEQAGQKAFEAGGTSEAIKDTIRSMIYRPKDLVERLTAVVDRLRMEDASR